MPDVNTLASRLDAEFSAVEQKVKKFQTEQVEAHKERQKRLEQLNLRRRPLVPAVVEHARLPHGRCRQPLAPGEEFATATRVRLQGFDAGPVNGKWGSEAQTAVRNFQQMKGLNVTGQLDKRTLDEMDLDADEFRSNPGSPSSGSMEKNR